MACSHSNVPGHYLITNSPILWFQGQMWIFLQHISSKDPFNVVIWKWKMTVFSLLGSLLPVECNSLWFYMSTLTPVPPNFHTAGSLYLPDTITFSIGTNWPCAIGTERQSQRVKERTSLCCVKKCVVADHLKNVNLTSLDVNVENQFLQSAKMLWALSWINCHHSKGNVVFCLS